MSTFGLDGVLPWPQARAVAAHAARPLPARPARLDEAAGSNLARDLVSLRDDPPEDSARQDGYAVCGEGPWLEDALDVLSPGWATPIRAGWPLPGSTDAVIPVSQATVRTRSDGRREVVMRDPLTGLPDEMTRPDLGSGILRQGVVSSGGHVLAPADSPVTPGLLALAAARGMDTIDVIPPPVVGVLVLGGELLDRGHPRAGRPRDALGHTVPSFVGELGARGNPAVRAPDTADLLLREIDDAAVDVLITTGSTAPGPDNHLRQVLRDLGAHWLIDGVAASPGAQMLLARLPDGRLLLGLPGDPPAALAALVTMASPLLATMRGDADRGTRHSAVLMDDTPPADYADDTALVPVELESSAAGTQARPLLPEGADHLGPWARAAGVAVIPPGAGLRGDVVEVLDPWGRTHW